MRPITFLLLLLLQRLDDLLRHEARRTDRDNLKLARLRQRRRHVRARLTRSAEPLLAVGG
jgi:hypothetical protein